MAEGSETAAVSGQDEGRRGTGRGGRFFVLDRDHWDRLWASPTKNRLNFVTAFLVLLAGTGADHRLTKWSTKACEERVGMGKPRAKSAIEELIAGGLAEHTDASRPPFPQYRLAAPTSAKEPIFLPVQLVTGLAEEAPVLRRVRETGDALVLRMLIDLYSHVQTDATYAIPLEMLRLSDNSETAIRKISEMGANAVWALHLGNEITASAGWLHWQKNVDWKSFWERLATLQRIGAIWFEPWVFDGEPLDAEPLFPVATPDGRRASDEAIELSETIVAGVDALLGERTYFREQFSDSVFVVLPVHHRPPAIRGVARLRVDADTPGRRLAHAKRMSAIERHSAAYKQLLADAHAGRYNRPMPT